MIGLFVMPLSASTIFFDEWIWGAVICKSWLSIDYIASTASIFNLLVLSVSRLVWLLFLLLLLCLHFPLQQL